MFKYYVPKLMYSLLNIVIPVIVLHHALGIGVGLELVSMIGFVGSIAQYIL